MNKSRLNKILATILVLTFSTSIGCSTWRPTPTTDITPDDAAALKGKRVRFYTDDGVTSMKVKEIEFPYAIGTGKQSGDKVRVDLRKVHKIEIHRVGAQVIQTILATVGIAALILAIALAAT